MPTKKNRTSQAGKSESESKSRSGSKTQRKVPALRAEIDPAYAEWKQMGRSYKKITKKDLKKLLSLAQKDNSSLKRRHPKYRQLKQLAICLCQGGALHYVDGKNGIRDFDVYTFYAEHPTVRYPVRRKVVADFGESAHGQSYGREDLKGRSVDLMGRQIRDMGDYKASICDYLEEQPTDTAHYLARKAVITLWPVEDMGDVVWK